MYHIAFQLLGDIWMLLGLLVMAFAPMATWHGPLMDDRYTIVFLRVGTRQNPPEPAPRLNLQSWYSGSARTQTELCPA